jgi:hypothetical protein
MNTENALAEQIRQYNTSFAEEQRQFNFYNKLGEFANFNRSSRGGGSSGGGGGYSGGGGDDYYYSTKNKTGSAGSTTYWNETERKSITASGAGPVTPYGLAQKEAQGKVYTYSDSKGNTQVSKTPVSAATSGAKPFVSASSSKSSGGVVSKVVNAVKNLFK